MFVVFKRSNKVTLLIGIIFGIGLAILFMKTEENLDSKHINLVKRPPRNFYRDLLKTEHLRREKLDPDLVSYGNLSESIERENVFLYDRIHVTCVVFLFNRKKAEMVKSTYGNHRHCNEVFFFASFNDSNLPIVELKSKSSWHHLCQAIRHVWSESDKLQWILFSHDELFAIPENLRYYIASSGFKHDQELYLGNPMSFWGQTYNSAKSGYVLSRAALLRFNSLFNSTGGTTCATGFNWRNEDFYLGKHLGMVGVNAQDTRDWMGRGRFHGVPLSRLLTSALSPLDSYRKKGIYHQQQGFECCNDETITFRASDPGDLFLFNYLVYKVRIFGRGWRGNQPFPISQDTMWLRFMHGINLDNASLTPGEFQDLWQGRLEE